MAIASYYSAEAERCRDLATIAADPEIARRWHQLADEYAVLAEELAAAEVGRTPILRPPIHQAVPAAANAVAGSLKRASPSDP